MPTYVLHIGPPKAGSTYLQSSLDALREPLLARGVLYQTEWLGNPRTINHEWILATLRAGRNTELEETFAALNRSHHRYVIISTEGLFGVAEEQLEYLRSMAAGNPFLIVYYCRRWSERIPSQWQQIVKSGRFTTLPEHFAHEARAPERYLDLNPKLVWDRFARVFGRESLRLMPFNTLVERKIDLLDHFLGALGIHMAERPAKEKVVSNVSPRITDTELLRALNYLYFRATGQRTSQVRVNFLRRLDTLDCEAITDMMKTDLGQLVVDDSSPMFRSLHDAMLEYTDRVVPVDEDRAFFQPKKRAVDFVQQNYLLQDGAIDMVRTIFDQVDPRRSSPITRAHALAS